MGSGKVLAMSIDDLAKHLNRLEELLRALTDNVDDIN
jgi:hypothetical protein